MNMNRKLRKSRGVKQTISPPVAEKADHTVYDALINDNLDNSPMFLRYQETKI